MDRLQFVVRRLRELSKEYPEPTDLILHDGERPQLSGPPKEALVALGDLWMRIADDVGGTIHEDVYDYGAVEWLCDRLRTLSDNRIEFSERRCNLFSVLADEIDFAASGESVNRKFEDEVYALAGIRPDGPTHWKLILELAGWSEDMIGRVMAAMGHPSYPADEWGDLPPDYVSVRSQNGAWPEFSMRVIRDLRQRCQRVFPSTQVTSSPQGKGDAQQSPDLDAIKSLERDVKKLKRRSKEKTATEKRREQRIKFCRPLYLKKTWPEIADLYRAKYPDDVTANLDSLRLTFGRHSTDNRQ